MNIYTWFTVEGVGGIMERIGETSVPVELVGMTAIPVVFNYGRPYYWNFSLISDIHFLIVPSTT